MPLKVYHPKREGFHSSVSLKYYYSTTVNNMWHGMGYGLNPQPHGNWPHFQPIWPTTILWQLCKHKHVFTPYGIMDQLILFSSSLSVTLTFFTQMIVKLQISFVKFYARWHHLNLNPTSCVEVTCKNSLTTPLSHPCDNNVVAHWTHL
jgi:hypothetical protein